MQLLGFSTGIFFVPEMGRSSFDLTQQLQMCLDAGATAVEINFQDKEVLSHPTEEQIDLLKRFAFVSIHAKIIDYAHASTEIEKLRAWCNVIPIKSIVVHADKISDTTLSCLSSDLPWSIENMDGYKSTYVSIETFENLYTEKSFTFVLDLQHCFEHDPTMELAQQFQMVMKERITHLHVSGHTKKENHIALSESDNKKEIVSALKQFSKTPIILEGRMFQPDVATLKNELAYIRSIFH